MHPQLSRPLWMMHFNHSSGSMWRYFLRIFSSTASLCLLTQSTLNLFSKVNYSKPPPSFSYYLQGTSNVDTADDLLATQVEIHTTLQRRLLKAQAVMKAWANKHHHDVQFSLRDWVYVKLKPYRQTFLAPVYTKLSKCYYEPFWVEERIGPIAYRLQLPASSRIHSVFHIFLLKPHQGPLSDSPAIFFPSASNHHPVVQPLFILDWKWDSLLTPPTKLVLVQWEGLAPEDTTWEQWDTLCSSYNLAYKVVFLKGVLIAIALLY